MRFKHLFLGAMAVGFASCCTLINADEGKKLPDGVPDLDWSNPPSGMLLAPNPNTEAAPDRERRDVPMRELTPAKPAEAVPMRELTPAKPAEAVPMRELTPAKREKREIPASELVPADSMGPDEPTTPIKPAKPVEPPDEPSDVAELKPLMFSSAVTSSPVKFAGLQDATTFYVKLEGSPFTFPFNLEGVRSIGGSIVTEDDLLNYEVRMEKWENFIKEKIDSGYKLMIHADEALPDSLWGSAILYKSERKKSIDLFREVVKRGLAELVDTDDYAQKPKIVKMPMARIVSGKPWLTQACNGSPYKGEWAPNVCYAYGSYQFTYAASNLLALSGGGYDEEPWVAYPPSYSEPFEFILMGRYSADGIDYAPWNVIDVNGAITGSINSPEGTLTAYHLKPGHVYEFKLILEDVLMKEILQGITFNNNFSVLSHAIDNAPSTIVELPPSIWPQPKEWEGVGDTLDIDIIKLDFVLKEEILESYANYLANETGESVSEIEESLWALVTGTHKMDPNAR